MILLKDEEITDSCLFFSFHYQNLLLSIDEFGSELKISYTLIIIATFFIEIRLNCQEDSLDFYE